MFEHENAVLFILIFVRDKLYCSTLKPLSVLLSNTNSLPGVKFENNFCPYLCTKTS